MHCEHGMGGEGDGGELSTVIVDKLGGGCRSAPCVVGMHRCIPLLSRLHLILLGCVLFQLALHFPCLTSRHCRKVQSQPSKHRPRRRQSCESYHSMRRTPTTGGTPTKNCMVTINQSTRQLHSRGAQARIRAGATDSCLIHPYFTTRGVTH